MNKTDLLTLFEYNDWANARILNAAAGLTAEQYAAPQQLSYGSLRGTLVHTLSAEYLWRSRGEGSSPERGIREPDVPGLEDLRSRWAEESRRMRSYLQGLTQDALDSRLEYKTTKGEPKAEVLWQILAHVVNHGTQHRSEAAIVLTNYGSSPGDIDMIVFVRERS